MVAQWLMKVNSFFLNDLHGRTPTDHNFQSRAKKTEKILKEYVKI